MFLKRLIDVSLSAMILLFLSPVLAIVALTIWLESGPPVLFRQLRVGKSFRNFYILKFRTMHAKSEGPSITVGGDSRVTRVGKILRVTKLDELPQFWNVLRGEMSIVGPRPEVPEYVGLFRERYRKVLTVRPGITDLASIYYRDEETILSQSEDPLAEYEQRVLPAKLDLADKYIRNHNMFYDLHIIAQTALVTVWPRGRHAARIQLRGQGMKSGGSGAV